MIRLPCEKCPEKYCHHGFCPVMRANNEHRIHTELGAKRILTKFRKEAQP